ncbi:unnamed protein product, partial [Brassica napus]
MAKVKSASLTLFVSATSTPRHGTATSPATSPVIFVAAPIDLRWSNREYLPPLSCLSFSLWREGVHLFHRCDL